jgi:hypothetical protein
MPTYVLLGHGNQSQDQGQINMLDRGFTLVTTSQCGEATYTGRSGRLLQVLKNNPNYANEPLRFQQELQHALGFRIHIYTEGQQYPNLVYKPESLHPHYFGLSGIVNLTNIDQDDIHLMTNLVPLADTTQIDAVNRSFLKSVWPTQQTAREVIINGNGEFPARSISDIFATLGPGVYYFSLCRGGYDEGDNVPPSIQYRRELSDTGQAVTVHAPIGQKAPKIKPITTTHKAPSARFHRVEQAVSVEAQNGQKAPKVKPIATRRGGRGKKRVTRRRKRRSLQIM